METIDDIIEILKGKRKFKISIFCGAGISVKSGLPATSSLLEYILLNLGIEPADIKSLKHIDGKWVMPFESFMEAFIEHDKNTRLFNLFLLGRPNHNHFLIKMLAAHACLDEVYTTNFDLLIERIFEAAPKIDFKVVLENDADSQNHFQRDKIIPIIKLHGTADDVDTIRGTILSITSGVEFGNRMKMIQRAFYSSSDILWFWGYSFSDVFDINPAIELIQPNNKTIILLKHDPSITEINRAIIVPLEQTDADHPLRKFKGYMIRIDSDSLVQRILGKEFIQIEDTVKPSEWQAIIEEWIESFEYKHTKYSILCHLFYNTAQYDLALKYNRLAIQLNSGKDKRGEGASLSNKGMILYCLGRVTDALVAFHNAFKIFRSIDYSFGVTTCYINFRTPDIGPEFLHYLGPHTGPSSPFQDT